MNTFGYEIVVSHPQPTPMLLMLSVHYSRVSQSIPNYLITTPAVPVTQYHDHSATGAPTLWHRLDKSGSRRIG